MDKPIQREECAAVYGVPVSHASDSHAMGAISGYNKQPKGIPTISRMNEDLSFTIIAAGHEQVERYLRAGSPKQYLAGEEIAQSEDPPQK